MKTIRGQMLFYLIIFSIVIFSAFGFFLWRQLREIPAFIQTQTQEIANSKSNEIDKELEGALDQVRMLAQSSLIKSMDIDAIKDVLPSLVLEDKYRNMTISDLDGNAWTTVGIDIDISEQEQYQKIILEGNDYYISRPFYSPFDGEDIPIITVSHVIKNNGETVGLINVVLTIEFINDIIEAVEFQQSGYAFIVHNDGYVIAYPNNEYDIDTHISEWIDIEGIKFQETLEHLNYLSYETSDGVQEIGFFSPINITEDWNFILAVHQAEVFYFYDNTIIYLQFAFTVFILVLIGFAVIYSETISKPISNLITTFESAASGNLDVKAPEKTYNELGRAGKSFNRMIEQIKNLTYRDTITGLYNFNSFQIELKPAINEFRSRYRSLAIVIVSIDDFKRINTLGGYETGNKVLSRVAAMLLDFTQGQELIGRYFGDEIILLIQAANKDKLENRIHQLAETLDNTIKLSNVNYQIRTSIGVSLIPENRHDFDTIIHEATMAKLVAKTQLGNTIRYYNDMLNRHIIHQQNMEEALFHALSKDAFYIVYQPIVGSDGETIEGLEALLRWSHPDFQDIPTIEWITLLERNGLIYDVGIWVMRTAINAILEWNQMYDKDLSISINVSPLQLEDAGFISSLETVLNETEIKPEKVNIEITETNIMTNVEEKILVLNQIKNLNVNISLDDFGTGYSSLAYIMRLPFDELKIDRSFTSKLDNQKSLSIIEIITTLGKSMNVRMVAEGVEDIEQYNILKNFGCHYYQGYYFHKPLLKEQVHALLKEKT